MGKGETKTYSDPASAHPSSLVIYPECALKKGVGGRLQCFVSRWAQRREKERRTVC